LLISIPGKVDMSAEAVVGVVLGIVDEIVDVPGSDVDVLDTERSGSCVDVLGSGVGVLGT
jgi:hypothetical protein